ncbi:MAG TPA: glycoside hydrolase family 57 protein [Candidatus Eisenbacteria bacterium]|nr:glycoside hydrolase family 57 protein [Candidatus Eisenbacteria bacterium]
MSGGVRVELILLWHQHQPDYRDPHTGRSRLPWVRLHATKDYVDMARRLEPFPRVKATFNFVPSLVDQIEAAARGEPDELFELLARDPRDLTAEERAAVARRCAQCPTHARSRWPALGALASRAESGAELPDSDLLALEIGFLLAWLDPLFHPVPEAVAAIGSPPRLEIRDGLLALHHRLLGDVIPVHRELHARGQIELSTSPYYHPILPLLVDLSAATRARPDLPLPRRPFVAPEDARLQLERAIARHAKVFGAPPRGVWPSEGSVSPEVAELAAGLGLEWLASDQGVLERSLDERVPEAHFRPWRLDTKAGRIHIFFRDHELSDRIGFVYQRWKAGDAVADFVDRLRRIGRRHAERVPIVSVMLDGENCWEGYEQDGGPFLDKLYAALASAEDIRTTTPAEVLARGGSWPGLSRLHSGSWIDADFHIWAGHPEKNRAWDLLGRARERLAAHPQAPEIARESLLKAEGSDWFWWLGDDHFTSDKALFDSLFRGHLRAIHEACGDPVPPDLEVPIAAVSRPGKEEIPSALLTPVIDGRQTDYYEWHDAGHRAIAGAGSAMHAGSGWFHDLYYGFDLSSFHLRADFVHAPGEKRALRIEWLEPVTARFEISTLARGEHSVLRAVSGAPPAAVPGAVACLDLVLELSLPIEALGIRPGDRVSFFVQILEGGRPVETAPASDAVRLEAPDESFDASVWSP